MVAKSPTTLPAGRFSGTQSFERLTSVGISLTSVTLTVKLCSVHSSPWSVLRILTVYEDLSS